jgi:hypothetical protein
MWRSIGYPSGVLAIGATLWACNSCQSTPAAVSPSTICAELSEAGCLQISSDCASSITVQLEGGAGANPLLSTAINCLAAGGTVPSCGGCP